jgi:hypothetical protein
MMSVYAAVSAALLWNVLCSIIAVLVKVIISMIYNTPTNSKEKEKSLMREEEQKNDDDGILGVCGWCRQDFSNSHNGLFFFPQKRETNETEQTQTKATSRARQEAIRIFLLFFIIR